MNPKDCRYTKGHTWVRVAGGEAVVGITDYAQKQLGSVLFIEVKQPGDRIHQSQPCGTVESEKATADIMSPITGEVIEVNEEVLLAPELVNKAPYGKGWLLRAALGDPSELASLMSAAEFEAYVVSHSG